MGAALDIDSPIGCIHSMESSALHLTAMGVQFAWDDLGDSAGLWKPEQMTLYLDRDCPMYEQRRVMDEFWQLCQGKGAETLWAEVRPSLSLVHSA